jgi:uncharacterized protein (DUF362 family)
MAETPRTPASTSQHNDMRKIASMDATVAVGVVPDYEQWDEIRGFVDSALWAHAPDPAWFAEPHAPRCVVVKPNWVQESHEYDPGLWTPVITHPHIVAAVVDRLAELMAGRGRIVVCDAPHTYADFEAITARGNLLRLLEETRRRWPSLCLEILDLRREVWVRRDEVIVERRPNPHDPRGYARLDLGRDSLFYRHGGEGRYYGADYDCAVVNEHHQGEVHEYLLAGTPIACDLFVNLPKLKTHKKTGLTCCLKNLVGINGDKNWLPHHTEGCPNRGGDEFPDQKLTHRLEGSVKRWGRSLALNSPVVGTWLYRKMRQTGKRVLGDSETVVRNGNWAGNDTCWRMALDLNRALLYGSLDGAWREALAPKRYLAIVDGIIGGEGNGPICPDPVKSGVLLGGANPAAVDAVAARLMGLEPRDLPIVARAFDAHRWPLANDPLEDVTVSDDRCGAIIALDDVAPAVPGGFRPHFGWSPLKGAA